MVGAGLSVVFARRSYAGKAVDKADEGAAQKEKAQPQQLAIHQVYSNGADNHTQGNRTFEDYQS